MRRGLIYLGVDSRFLQTKFIYWWGCLRWSLSINTNNVTQGEVIWCLHLWLINYEPQTPESTCRGQHPGICLLTRSPWAWPRVLSPGLGKALLSGASLWFTSQIPISSGSKTYILTLFPALAHSTPWTHYLFSLSDLQFLKLQIENSTCWINEASNKCKLKKWISWWQHLVNNGCSHAGFP